MCLSAMFLTQNTHFSCEFSANIPRVQHDGAGLHLPLRVLLPAQLAQHQACRGLAPLQPGVPLPGHPGQHCRQC